MEGVDHVHVVKVGGRGLVGEVHGVLERQVPYGEGLKLRVARVHAVLVLVVELGEAGGHLAAAGAGGGDDDERMGRLDVFVAAEAIVADDVGNVGGVAGDGVVAVVAHAQRVEALNEGVRRALSGVLRDAHAADIQPQRTERVDQAQAVVIVGDAEVAAHLVLLNVVRADHDDDLRIVAQLLEHADLAVGLEAGQHARSVKIVKQLAAEFKIQLAAELADALADVRGLHGEVFIVVKTNRSHRKKHLILSTHNIETLYRKQGEMTRKVHAEK